MPRKIPPMVWVVLPLMYFLYFYQLGAAGMLGPDEPRYASIGREMARSGDWITPRLWGQPWFEKPALLYWMTGTAFRLGLSPDLAPRLPVALLSVAFLGFFWWILRREFGCRAAWLATLILATSGEWMGFSQVGATDLPMAALFSAAMLAALPWVVNRDQKWLPFTGALLGLAVLAKGLVPLGLAVPLLWPAWRDRRRLIPALARLTVPFLAIAVPWYLLCYLRNGPEFLIDFFWKHHFERMTSDVLMHRQPFWFYVPVFIAAMLPWAPLLWVAWRRSALADPRRVFLMAIVIWGILLFSVSVNKLPGYILPLVPLAAVLMGVGLDETVRGGKLLVLCALQLFWFPIAAGVLPAALASGLSRASLPSFHWTWLLPLLAVTAVWMLERQGRRLAAVACLAAGVTVGMAHLKNSVMPEVDRLASARPLWREIESKADQVCVEEIRRSWRYGLDFYSVTPLPACSTTPRPLHIVQTAGNPPYVMTVQGMTTVDPPASRIVTSRFQD